MLIESAVGRLVLMADETVNPDDAVDAESTHVLSRREQRRLRREIRISAQAIANLERLITNAKAFIAQADEIFKNEEYDGSSGRAELESQFEDATRTLAKAEEEKRKHEERIAEIRKLLGMQEGEEIAPAGMFERAKNMLPAVKKALPITYGMIAGFAAYSLVGAGLALIGASGVLVPIAALSAGAFTAIRVNKKIRNRAAGKSSAKAEESAEQEEAEANTEADEKKEAQADSEENAEARAEQKKQRLSRNERKLKRITDELEMETGILGGMEETDKNYPRQKKKVEGLAAKKEQLEGKIGQDGVKNAIPEDPLPAYIALLHAKSSMFRTKFQKEIINNAEEISKNFRDALAGALEAGNLEQNLKALNDISLQISKGLNESKGFMEKAITAFRSPGASTARLALGLTLMAGGIAIHGLTIGFLGVAIAPLIAAPAAVGTALFGIGLGLGIVGRFLGADALYDKIHLAITGRAKNGETAIAARVFRNDDKRIERSIMGVYTKTEETEIENPETQAMEKATATSISREISVDGFDSALQGYANSIRKNKFYKTAISIAAAAVVPMFQLFGAEHASAVPQPKAPAVADSAGVAHADTIGVAHADSTIAHADSSAAQAMPPKAAMRIPGEGAHTGGAASAVGIHGAGDALYPNNLTTVTGDASYAVGKGQGIWHVAEKIAEKNVPGLSGMPQGQRLQVVDAIKDAIVKNPSDFGLRSTFLHPGTTITCTLEQMKGALAAGGVTVEFPAAGPVGLGGGLDLLRTTVNPDSTLFADSLAIRQDLLRTAASGDTTGYKSWSEGFRRYYSIMPDSTKVDSLGYLKKMPLKR